MDDFGIAISRGPGKQEISIAIPTGTAKHQMVGGVGCLVYTGGYKHFLWLANQIIDIILKSKKRRNMINKFRYKISGLNDSWVDHESTYIKTYRGAIRVAERVCLYPENSDYVTKNSPVEIEIEGFGVYVVNAKENVTLLFEAEKKI